MQFISTNVPTILNPAGTYSSTAMYIYAFWIRCFVGSFIHVKLFEQVSHIKVSIWVYLTYAVTWVLLLISVGAEIVKAIIFVILMYYFVTRRNTSVTNLVTYYIYANTIFYLAMGLLGSTVASIISIISPTNAYMIRNLLYLPMLLGEFALAYWVIKKTQHAVNNFVQIVATAAPVFTWCFVIFMFSFEIIKFAVISGASLIPFFVYILIIIAYFLIMMFVIKYVTRYFHYQSLLTNRETELANLQTYTSHIEEMFDDLRRFRHDYKNILVSLGGAIEEGNIDEVRSIYDRTVVPTSNHLGKQAVLSHLINIKDCELKSLTYSKVMTAIGKNINIEVEVVDPIVLTSKLNILDAIRILSILFDNAINAASIAKNGKINFSFFNKDNDQYIVIGNSTKEAQVDAAKVNGTFKGLTPQKHSLGLRTLRILLAKYPFIQHNYKSNNYWFEQEIIIHNTK